MNFKIIIISLILSYWAILYLLFWRFRKDKSKPIYKLFSFWLTAVFSTIGIYVICVGILIHMMFGSKDLTDSGIQYGNEIMSGEYDGLMLVDRIEIYDNQTFYILALQIESNGRYSMRNDTIELYYNENHEGDLLPDIFVVREDHLLGYKRIGNQIDTTNLFYFSLHTNPEN